MHSLSRLPVIAVTIVPIAVFVFGAAAMAASGLQPGEEVTAWEPVHVAGPHAGTKTCPVCTYLDAPMLLAFTRDVSEARKLATTFEEIAAAHRHGRLKVLLVVVDGTDEELLRLAKNSSLRRLMLCRPDPDRREEQLQSYKVDPSAPNTVMLYADYRVRNTWSPATAADLLQIKQVAALYLPKR